MIGSGDNEIISSVISSFTRQNEALIKQLQQLMYYFRGSLGRDDAWAMCYAERELAISFLNDRFKEVGEIWKKQKQVTLFI